MSPVLYQLSYPDKCLRVAAAGVEPAFRGYEPPVVPFHQAAISQRVLPTITQAP